MAEFVDTMSAYGLTVDKVTKDLDVTGVLSEDTTEVVKLPVEKFIQLSATGVNPAGGVKAATADELGIFSTLRFDDAVDNVAALAFAIPGDVDRTQPITIRLGFAATTNTGNTRFGLAYQLVAADTDISAGSDDEIITLSPVSGTASGYTFSAPVVPVVSEADRVIGCYITRYGGHTDDTCSGAAHLLGILLAYTPKAN